MNEFTAQIRDMGPLKLDEVSLEPVSG